ncbi:transposase IS3/IS911 family protein [Caldalkalibacillus thermarum TA2.A1]|uniref:Transposase n=1 Tax=Caldalkalibacillus thermarum (strain TA2.A1) TaxID=986075 RepID=F5LB73_CALTT|nr:transposase [Caldalkalibacillus thermarum]EGL81411.1 transposase IS3/IS911 family protein [Caldalkalibacillus thermarum TA2.A1]QZT33058.1 transposase [Caldalkalibacillus thermarum TA2.A1]QZT34758.1 transposase [Caldalkalibacillus thermarum TA2.A1]
MKRQRHSVEFKIQVVKEALEAGNKAAVARRYDIHPNLVHRWTKEYQDGKFGDVDITAIPTLDAKALSQENEQLKKLLGEKDLEIAILRDLLKKKNPHLLKKLK